MNFYLRIFILSFLLHPFGLNADGEVGDESSPSPTEEISFPKDYVIDMPPLGAEYYTEELKVWDKGSKWDGDLYEKLDYDPATNKMIPLDRAILNSIVASKDELYGVLRHFPDIKASTIAGCILAENTMNVSVSDKAQEWLAKNSETVFSIAATLFGKSANTVSLGLGQINVEAARDGEPYVMKVQGRSKARTDSEIKDAVMTPKGSYLYAAGIIQNAIDKYKEQGIDIRHRPDIQCTLYNLGGHKNRALKTKESGKSPKPNYFGFFVNHYFQELNEHLGDTIPKGGLSADNFKLNQHNWSKRQAEAIQEVPLYKSIPNCFDEPQSVKTNIPSTGPTLKGKYREIAFQVDCNLQAWTYIKDGKGRFGWAPSYQLQMNTIYSALGPEEYKKLTGPQCLEPADKASIDSCRDDIKKMGLRVDFDHHNNIILRMEHTREQSMQRRIHPVRKDQFEQWKYSIDEKKEAILKYAKRKGHVLSGWDDDKNPWRDLFTWMDDLKQCMDDRKQCVVDHNFHGNYRFTEAFHERGLLNDDNYAERKRENLRNIKIIQKREFNTVKVQPPNFMSENKKQSILWAVEYKKKDIVTWLNKNKNLNLSGWDDPNNPQKGLFHWYDELKACDKCTLEVPKGRNWDQMRNYIIEDGGLLSSQSRLDFIRDTKVVESEAFQFPEDTPNRDMLNIMAKSFNACEEFFETSLGWGDRFVQLLTYRFNDLARSHPDDVATSKLLPSLRTELDNLTNQCKIINKCSDWETSKAWKECNEFNDKFDISFYCEIVATNIKGMAKKSLDRLDCLVEGDYACDYRNIPVEKLNKLAELPCIEQVLFTRSRELDHSLADSNASTALKNKAVFFDYPNEYFIAATVKGACLETQAIPTHPDGIGP